MKAEVKDISPELHRLQPQVLEWEVSIPNSEPKIYSNPAVSAVKQIKIWDLLLLPGSSYLSKDLENNFLCAGYLVLFYKTLLDEEFAEKSLWCINGECLLPVCYYLFWVSDSNNECRRNLHIFTFLGFGYNLPKGQERPVSWKYTTLFLCSWVIRIKK